MVLPMPASPARSSSVPRPWRASAAAACSRARSVSRPISAPALAAPAISVAEDGGSVADPLPQRRCAPDLRVVDQLRGVELARVKADRADEQLAAVARVVGKHPVQRRATITG